MKHQKRIAVILAAAVLLTGSAVVWRHRTAPPDSIPAASETDRQIYLFTQGWKGELLSAGVLTVPADTDAVFAPYADLQEAQGLPVRRYAGVPVKRYTYRLSQSDLYAELLCADGILIGAMCYHPEKHDILGIQGKKCGS